MPNQPQASLENNFSGGLKTEFTGLNFPENACTSASNCIFSIIGDVNRRLGFDFETNYQLNTINSPVGMAISTYKWNNVGGDGSTQVEVQQVGSTLYFYQITNATIAAPLSTTKLASTVNVSSFVASGGSYDATVECQYTDGNGFLFVFHPNVDPFYCTFNAGVITATRIDLQIRDTNGIVEPGIPYNQRPLSLTPEHQYNLANQGWGYSWTATSITINTIGTGSFTWNIGTSTLPIAVGSLVTAFPTLNHVNLPANFITGTVSSYTGTLLTITETANGGGGTFGGNVHTDYWNITPAPNYINTFFNTAKIGGTPLNAYPSNAEQWWWYRNTNITTNNPDGTFKPSALADYVVLSNVQAPKGSIIFDAFNQDRSAVSGIINLTPVTTTARPVTGAWFQGRVFYSGVNSSQQATGDASYFTWTEDIYFSKIMEDVSDFGRCFQVNDPTNDKLFNLLPSDGGVITIQGSGAIYKLFPLKFGLLVFAANGIWYISGSTGIGFTANDYTITKISNVQSISGTSVVNVLGWPVFWNEEGIYEVKPTKEAGSAHSPDIALDINNLCLGTILSFYQNIPLQSKKYARGDYDPNSYVIQWLYRSTNESNITSRYQFDSALNINTYKGPFYPYSFTISPTSPYVCGITYVAGPGGSTSPSPTFKYLTVSGTHFTFSEEKDNVHWEDWNSTGTPVDYTSTFTSGYKLHGSAWKLWQLGYVYLFSENTEQTSYIVRGLWDYGTSGNSGKWSTGQKIINNIPNFGNVFRKVRIRGRGLALQLQISSVTGYPFNFAGWSMWEQINQSI
jgi:hypothetical protein